MCNFFSFVSDGMGKTYYFDKKLRKEIVEKASLDPDSHDSIVAYFEKDILAGSTFLKHVVSPRDHVNSYEYNPKTKVFTVDRINVEDDSSIVEKWVRGLNFNKIIERPKNLYEKLYRKVRKLEREDLKGQKPRIIEKVIKVISSKDLNLTPRKCKGLASFFAEKISLRNAVRFVEILDKMDRCSIEFHRITKVHLTLMSFEKYKKEFYDRVLNLYCEMAKSTK